jgi:hypothetical protein
VEEKVTKKARFIERMEALSRVERETAIVFFSKYPVYESHINWNDKSLTYRDFENVFIKADTSCKNFKRRAKVNPEVLFEKYNCRLIYKKKDFLIIIPLDWECAVFFNSFECGGTGAKWCIGDKNFSNHWNNYTSEGNVFLLVYFKKIDLVFGRKLIFQYNIKTNESITWNVENKAYISDNFFIAPFRTLLCCWLLRYEEKINNQMFFSFDIFEKIDLPEKTINDFGRIFTIQNPMENDAYFFWIL